MTLIEKMLALKRTPPFDRLYDAELTLIAEVARERHYAPGEVIISQRRPVHHLVVVVDGETDSEGESRGPRLTGVASLLFDAPVTQTVSASRQDGATCLLIAKSHFHTIVNACPELVVGLLEGHGAAAGAPA
jgi:signal-transduction protein with cAMP-binding, CBS, and nucleotidyltransferase domain